MRTEGTPWFLIEQHIDFGTGVRLLYPDRPFHRGGPAITHRQSQVRFTSLYKREKLGARNVLWMTACS
jgi:hypothetical protein